MAEAEPAAALDLAVALSVLGFTGPALAIFGDALDNVDAWRAGRLQPLAALRGIRQMEAAALRLLRSCHR